MTSHAAAPAAVRPATNRPSSISTAFALWIVEIFVSATSGVLIVIAAANTPQVENLPAAESGIAAGVLIGLGIAIAAIALLRAYFAIKMRDGANWARIVLTVLGAINLLGIAGGGWVSFVAAAFTFAAVAAMWMPTSQTFFAVAAQRR